MKDMIELAKGLQHSNIAEVSALAKAYLALKTNYDEMEHKYVMACADVIMERHAKLFQDLADAGD